ncbi:hypothetical protein, partial [Klebsiella pneumoniae]|uniref:hypothetical protein n=1 Tax=Klebsiella pneumoniae TaxID=573 RepID=UPI00405589BC
VNSLTTQIRSLMRIWKTAKWHERLRSTHGDHRKFWKLLKTTKSKISTVRLHEGETLLTTEQQAKKLAEHYAGDITARTGDYHIPPRLETERNHMFVSPKQLKAILRRLTKASLN